MNLTKSNIQKRLEEKSKDLMFLRIMDELNTHIMSEVLFGKQYVTTAVKDGKSYIEVVSDCQRTTCPNYNGCVSTECRMSVEGKKEPCKHYLHLRSTYAMRVLNILDHIELSEKNRLVISAS